MNINIIEQFINDYDKAFAANEKHKAELAALNLELEQIDRDLMEEEMDSALDHILLWNLSCVHAEIAEGLASLTEKMDALKKEIA
jgi:hypothetical protein